jgi:hypothetical protein
MCLSGSRLRRLRLRRLALITRLIISNRALAGVLWRGARARGARCAVGAGGGAWGMRCSSRWQLLPCVPARP